VEFRLYLRFKFLREIENFLKDADYGKDVVVEFGRRLGWYILVRSQKPRIIVETGVDHGVGSLVLTSALLRNKSEKTNFNTWIINQFTK
jgi:predicted O-methyltransferase YrrM